MLKAAWDVLNGAFPFRDTFIMHGVATTYLQAAALAVLGPTLTAIRDLTTLFYGLNAVALYAVWRGFMPRWLAAVGSLVALSLAPFWIKFLPWSSVYAIFAQLVSLLLIVRAVDGKGLANVFWAALVAVLVFGLRQPVGLFHLGAMGAFFGWMLWADRERRAFWWRAALLFAGTAVAAFAAFVGWLYLNGALDDWFRQTGRLVEVLLVGQRGPMGIAAMAKKFVVLVGQIYHSLLGKKDVALNWGASFEQASLIWGGSVMACIAFLFRAGGALAKGRGPADPITVRLFLAATAGLSAALQSWPMPDFNHYAWGDSLGVGLFVYAFWLLAGGGHAGWWSKAGTVVLVLFVFTYDGIEQRVLHRPGTAWAVVSGDLQDRGLAVVKRPAVLAGMVTSTAYRDLVENFSKALDAYVAEHPDAQILNMTPGALFLTFRSWQKNFHPLFVDFGHFRNAQGNFLYPDFDRQRDAFVAANRPLIVATEPDYPGYRVLFSAPSRSGDGLFLLEPAAP